MWKKLEEVGLMGLYGNRSLFDNGLDSVGSALQLVLLARRFLVSDIPKGAERVRGLVTAN